MFRKRVSVAAFAVGLLGVLVLPGVGRAQGEISLTIAKHASLTSDGAVVIRVLIECEPLPGTEDFQEALAGAAQAKTGAEAEGGIDGTVTCDGVPRTYTATLSSFTDAAFRPGPAHANASLLVCNVVGDDQVCAQGSTERRIVIRGKKF
jgi:hypothetical protein